MRAHVLLPDDLMEELDRRAGKRGRSRLIEEVMRDWLRRQRLLAALRDFQGAFADDPVPGWEDPVGWVRQIRAESDRRLRRALGEEAAP